MKKFLFILSFTLASPLLSAPLFEELFYETHITHFFVHDFLPEDMIRKNSLRCLKHLAKTYLKILEATNGDHELLKNMWPENVNALVTNFELDVQAVHSLVELFKTNIETWLKRSQEAFHYIFMHNYHEFDYIKKIAIPTDEVEMKKLLKTMTSDAIIQMYKHEETSAFIKALIQVCKEELQALKGNVATLPHHIRIKNNILNQIDKSIDAARYINECSLGTGILVGAIGGCALGAVVIGIDIIVFKRLQ